MIPVSLRIKPPELNIRLPDWVAALLEKTPDAFPEMAERMRFVIQLSQQNVANKTGGPFAAAVFEKTGRLVAPGVNLVISAQCSVLHAEIVAIALAQKTLMRYAIGDGGRFDYDLFTSTEPCAMCFGAVCWSGVNRLVCGARAEDAEAIGFDEGPKPSDWVSALNARGIAVVRDVLRKEAAAVHQAYLSEGGAIYNPGRKNLIKRP